MTRLCLRNSVNVVHLTMSAEELFNLKMSDLKVSVNTISIKTEEQYNSLINEVMDAKNHQVKTSTDYSRLKR